MKDAISRLALHLPYVIVSALVFLSAGYIRNSRPGWNVNSQFALTCAIVEKGTLAIDDYHEHPAVETGDKAFYDGHFYCDKSPVTPFLGVPAFALYRSWKRILGETYTYIAARRWTTWLTIGTSAAALAWLIAITLARRGISPPLAAALSGLWIMATPLYGYSILFFNYVPACAIAMAGWVILDSLSFTKNGFIRKQLLLLFIAGIFLGLASWTLQTVALLAMLAGFLPVIRARHFGIKSFLTLVPYAAGGFIGAAGYAIYSLCIFGRIASPYEYEHDPYFREMMSQGVMGASWPNPVVLLLITFHPYRGLFTLFPITLIATFGALSAFYFRRDRASNFIALVFLAGLLTYNAGYYMWWGGWSYAPRHLIPALALLPIGLTPFCKRRGIALSVFFIGIIGATLNLIVVSLDPQFPPGMPLDQLSQPALSHPWPIQFLDMLYYVANGQTDHNWGTDLGLEGLMSLFPLAILWALGFGMLYGTTAKHQVSRP